jgi:glycosyltransferase involved in cell wall biosynthesis
MLNRLRNKIYIDRKIKQSFTLIEKRLLEIRSKSAILAICPMPTNNSWRGVLTATLGLFPESTFQIPQYFSNQVYSESELKVIAEIVIKLNFDKIVFSGYPPYFKQLMYFLSQAKHEDLFLIYHGSFSSNREDATTAKLLYEIIKLQKDGVIRKIGFVKKGMSETFSKLTSINACHITLFTNIPENKPKVCFPADFTNIGVFTHGHYRKNIDNQMAAALMVNNVKVHTRKDLNYNYLFSDDKIVYHPFFEQYDDFLQILGSMDVNLYISFSECFGQVITESLALGVPCLAAENSGVFDFDEELRGLLIVKEFDNSNAIYNQIEIVLKHREIISEKCREYIQRLNKVSDVKMNLFLKDL